LRLLAQLQLAFVIFINVQNFSSLLAFKRFLILLARSERIFRQAELRDEGGLSLQSIEELYLQLLRTLAAQLQSLPETFFTVDLAGTGMQDFWREELQALCSNLARAHVDTAMPKPNPMSGPMQEAVSHLKRIARERFQWTFDAQDDSDSEDEDLEEGEDAPVIVDVDV
jgi:A1 cistron-splicing factor AAR2